MDEFLEWALFMLYIYYSLSTVYTHQAKSSKVLHTTRIIYLFAPLMNRAQALVFETFGWKYRWAVNRIDVYCHIPILLLQNIMNILHLNISKTYLKQKTCLRLSNYFIYHTSGNCIRWIIVQSAYAKRRKSYILAPIETALLKTFPHHRNQNLHT